ncbi:MAG TPA: protein phosphatase 2C domain-containing protein [Opitutaceae bacterium]|nr:protein phosphatase 2C domain-containing protein [Opitutaceae bacterium]
MHLRSAAISDIGRIRRINEDRILRDEALHLYGVADGVGGLPGGAEAAQCAVEVVHHNVAQSAAEPDMVRITLGANEAVAQLGMRFSPHFGIGTTLTWGLFRRGELRLAHVGDSRCYALRGGEFECLTMDHSVENEARARRARGELIWVSEQHRNALTRCIGQSTPLDVDVVARPLQEGDRYLFCSDGVTRMIRENELADHIGRDAEPSAIVRDLVDVANQRGGLDNATAVLIYVDSLT